MKTKFKKFEMEMCECGHEAPIGFIVYDGEACGTCMNCHIEYLSDLIKEERRKSKRIRSKLRAQNHSISIHNALVNYKPDLQNFRTDEPFTI